MSPTRRRPRLYRPPAKRRAKPQRPRWGPTSPRCRTIPPSPRTATATRSRLTRWWRAITTTATSSGSIMHVSGSPANRAMSGIADSAPQKAGRAPEWAFLPTQNTSRLDSRRASASSPEDLEPPHVCSMYLYPHTLQKSSLLPCHRLESILRFKPYHNCD